MDGGKVGEKTQRLVDGGGRRRARDDQTSPPSSFGWQRVLYQLAQTLAIYLAVKYVFGNFLGPSTPQRQKAELEANPSTAAQPPSLGSKVTRGQGSEIGPGVTVPQHEDSIYFPPSEPDAAQELIWKEDDLTFGDWHEERMTERTIQLPASVQHNGSLFGHIYISKQGSVLTRGQRGWDDDNVVYMSKVLTRYQRKAKQRKAKNLLSGSEVQEEEERLNELAGEIVSHWYPNVTIALVSDLQPIAYTKVPPAVRKFVHLDSQGRTSPTGEFIYHYPVIYDHDFWMLQSNVFPINSSTEQLPLYLKFHPISLTKFNIFASLDESFRQQSQVMSGGGNSGELDEVKRIFLEGNPYLLGITIFVSLLHTLFEFLAFKNDVSHFKNLKDQTGISVRTIVSNVIMQLIITLYLFDQKEGTSWVILGSQGVGVAIEAWKITRAVEVKLVQVDSIIPYRIRFEDKHKLSETEQKTKDADKVAFYYLSMSLVPLIMGYATWSLVYQEHKSFYSFVISTLAGCVYTWGFILLLPQLYVNYQLKSVAHIPFRAMIYKFLNTIVDDLGGFIIAMPILHRISLFKDDVAFLILLYQMWIYPVDKTRVNEFGQGPLPEETADGKINVGTARASAESKKFK